jgi:hypothetical protein
MAGTTKIGIGNGLEASLIEDAEKLHRRERARQLTFCQTIQNKQYVFLHTGEPHRGGFTLHLIHVSHH